MCPFVLYIHMQLNIILTIYNFPEFNKQSKNSICRMLLRTVYIFFLLLLKRTVCYPIELLPPLAAAVAHGRDRPRYRDFL